MKLSVHNLTKSFQEKIVLNNISFELNNFHSLAIIGPSGGGKSTLLRILAGLEKPDSGDIYVNGTKIDYAEESLREYRKTLGMVFQAYNLFPHLSAIDNILLPLVHVHNVEKKLAREKSEHLLQRFHLMAHKDKFPYELSGGQQQRVAVARALALDSTFLLFDEPTSSLDPELTSEVLEMIQELKDQKKDLILVTHEMGFARQACDQVIFIHDGIIREMGNSQTLFTTPKTTERHTFLHKVLEWK